jgi:peroxiredoxin Q/BCP
VIGVSPDTVKKHVKFKAKHGFTYPLIADTEHVVSELYGVWVQKSMFGRKYWGVNRTTFVIDANGRVTHVFDKVKLLGHAEEVASIVAGLKP